MKIEEIPIQIHYGKLPQSPGLLLKWVNDVSTERLQFLIRRIDVFREHPVNYRLKRGLPLPKEYRRITAQYGPNGFTLVKPSNLKAKCVSVVLLCVLDISDWQLRHWRAKLLDSLFCGHSNLLIQ